MKLARWCMAGGLLVILTVVNAGCAAEAGETGNADTLNQEWLDKDLALVKSISKVISQPLPEGRVAMDELTKGGRYDLIRAILRGSSPEGRTYAALALIAAHKQTADDQAVVTKLKLLNVPIKVCNGCLVSNDNFGAIISK